MAVLKLIHLLLLVTAVAFTTAAPEEDGKLQILSLSPDKLRAIYHTSAEEGIEVTSKVTDQENHLSISTLSGVVLVSARSTTGNSAMFWKIMDYSIFLYNNTIESGAAGMVEYAVPPADADHVEKEMKEDHITTKLLRTLNTDTVEMKRSAFSELFARPELESIVDMASALGAAGINGYENPAALNFYGVILNFAKLRNRIADGLPLGPSEREEPQEGPTVEPTVFVPRRIAKRATCSRPGWWGSTISYQCSSGCPQGSDCTGMCGRTCSCWSWVCGDCCYHQGCYDHDICCGVNGYFHYTCILVLPFSCSGYRYQC